MRRQILARGFWHTASMPRLGAPYNWLADVLNALPSDRKIAFETALRSRYCSGLALLLATTMEECRAARSALFVVRQNRKRVIYWLSLGGAMLILPTFCPDCNEPTMEVVEHRPNDSYEARCTACGCETFGKISVELLIRKHAVESTR